MIGTLTNIEIEQVIKNQMVGRLGCAANGKVYIVPITYAYDGEYIYGHSREGMKIQMMRQNPNVCFEVDTMADMSNWQCIVIQGEFQELMGEKARTAMDYFIKSIEPYSVSETGVLSTGMNHFHQKNQSITKTVIFRIKINEKSGRYEKQSSTRFRK
jgi:nitroimidazol reductase NimA-like FMN-containing flavoprotein (pyridoxamine 5'-phosphate oxidase superfamily)